MTTTLDIRDVSTRRLQEAIAAASGGDEVTLVDGTKPLARLVPCNPAATRVLGLHPGAMEPAPDFDEPLPDEFWTGQP